MVNIGVIGVGYWGPNLIQNFYKLPGANIISICDQNLKKLGRIKEDYPENGQ